MTKVLRFYCLLALFICTLIFSLSCGSVVNTTTDSQSSTPTAAPVVLGYSNWPGWWPWEIAEQEGLFEANGANVELKWFFTYGQSLKDFAAGRIDANSQTLSDTVSFLPKAINQEVVVLINDNSAGNHQLIVSKEINSLKDLKSNTGSEETNSLEDVKKKRVALEAGVAGDYFLTLILEKAGISRDEIEIVSLDSEAAAVAFAYEKVDAVVTFAPYTLIALEREGSKALITSAEYPGAIPNLLVVSQKLIDEQPDQVQALVNTWFDILAFMKENPQRANEIMAKRARISTEAVEKLKEGTRLFTPEDNLEAFSYGNTMQHIPFAAEKSAKFLIDVNWIPSAPDLSKLFDKQFVVTYIQNQ